MERNGAISAQTKMDRALEDTDSRYHPFIVGIHGTPYMQVNGRVLMAHDEAKEAGTQVNMTSHFDMVGDILTCCVEMTTLRGTAQGTASVHIGGTGVDKTNPIENAETSAVGRALGFLGYGILGGGIASAEEVEDAQRRQARGFTPEGEQAIGNMFGDALPTEPASEANGPRATDKQLSFLRLLCEQKGWAPAETQAFMDTYAVSVQQASDAIGQLKAGIDPRGQKAEAETQSQEVADERLPMTEPVRKRFNAKANHLGRWKEGWKTEVKAEIVRRGWGTTEKPDTSGYLTEPQQEYILAHIAALPSPSYSELFGEYDTWANVTAWAGADAIQLAPWDLAIYISDKMAPEGVKRAKPEDLPESVVAEVEAELVKDGDGFLDKVLNYVSDIQSL